jgi:N-acetylneuraminic acid mutarotase
MKKLLLLLLFIFGISTAKIPAQNSWEKKTSLDASKRARAVAFTIGSRGYLACGEDTNDVEKNDLWEYDPGSDSWTQKATLPAVGRRDAVGFSIGTKGYVGTGIDAAEAFFGNSLSDFWEYSPVTNSWTQKAAYPGGFGQGIYFATGFAVSGKGYVCCGKVSASFYSQELWEFNPTTNSWLQRANYPAGVRYGQTSFTIGNKAYAGTGVDENWFVTDFYEYNPGNNTWLQKAPFPGSARGFASSFSIGGKGFIGNGTDGGYRDDWFIYDVPSNSWGVIAPFGGEGRRSAPSFVVSGAAYVMTGKGNAGKHRDSWQYEPYFVGMDESNPVTVSVYPNPATEEIHFQLDPFFVLEHENLHLILTSPDGKTVRSFSVNNQSRIDILHIDLASGLYIWSLTDNQTNFANGKIAIR